jgi:hypothetical protein
MGEGIVKKRIFVIDDDDGHDYFATCDDDSVAQLDSSGCHMNGSIIDTNE